MKKIVVLFMLVFAFSCGPDYDGEKRLVFETQVTDLNKIPIPGERVQIEVFEDARDDYGSSDDVISDGFTDANGNIRLIFPLPVGYNARMTVHYSGNPLFLEKHISNISVGDFNGYKLNMSPVKLYRPSEITTFGITLNHTGNDTDISEIAIEGMRPDTYFDFGLQAPVAGQNNYYYDWAFIKNQNLTVRYIVTDYSAAQTTPHADIVAIGNSPVNYTITY